MGKIMLNSELYGVGVEANPEVPSGTPAANLSTLKIDNEYFNIPSGGSGSGVIPYLKSDGTQYINTGIQPRDTLTTEMKFFIDYDQNNPSAGWQILFGGNDGNTVNSCMFGFNLAESKLTCQMGGAYGDISKYVQPFDIHTISNVKGYFGYDGENITRFAPATFQSVHPIYLLAENQNGSIVQASIANICIVSFRAWSNNIMLVDLVPVSTNDVDNKPCLLDKISGTFFRNANVSGNDFVYGER